LVPACPGKGYAFLGKDREDHGNGEQEEQNIHGKTGEVAWNGHAKDWNDGKEVKEDEGKK
jgi:hypothetical protein